MWCLGPPFLEGSPDGSRAHRRTNRGRRLRIPSVPWSYVREGFRRRPGPEPRRTRRDPALRWEERGRVQLSIDRESQLDGRTDGAEDPADRSAEEDQRDDRDDRDERQDERVFREALAIFVFAIEEIHECKGETHMPPYPLCTHESLQSRRSEEHTSELQSHSDLVCRLLLEKKKQERSEAELSYLTILSTGLSLEKGSCIGNCSSLVSARKRFRSLVL